MVDRYEGSDTGNWNIAENWSNEMIFRPFYEASQYLIMARFGSSDIEEDFMFDDQTKMKTRIKALMWAKEKLEQAIRQCIFAVRNSNDKIKVEAFFKDIKELDKYINLVEEKIVDRDTFKIRINEETFKLIYDVLNRIFTEVTEPLNRSDLIFNYREQFDPKKFKSRIKDELIEEG